MPESSRIAALRRRVQEDPASIAFAQLAEEYRRLGRHDEAVGYCRSGLARHPDYLSARVTLARALVGLGAWAEAAAELDVVLRSAPDNVIALRTMAEVHQHRGDSGRANQYRQRALALGQVIPEPDQIAADVDGGIAATGTNDEIVGAPVEAAPAAEPLLDFDALLASFGVPSAAPSPLIETMIAGSTPLLDRAVWAPHTPDALDAGAQEDELAALERELRAFETGTARGAPAAAAGDGMPPGLGDSGLRELEAWLQALAEARTRARRAP